MLNSIRREEVRNRNREVYEDIYDGNLYRYFVDKGFLKEPNNISLLFNTDGIGPFKSSKRTCWPVYMAVNELLPEER